MEDLLHHMGGMTTVALNGKIYHSGEGQRGILPRVQKKRHSRKTEMSPLFDSKGRGETGGVDFMRGVADIEIPVRSSAKYIKGYKKFSCKEGREVLLGGKGGGHGHRY